MSITTHFQHFPQEYFALDTELQLLRSLERAEAPRLARMRELKRADERNARELARILRESGIGSIAGKKVVCNQ
jgi:hypothetical protein